MVATIGANTAGSMTKIPLDPLTNKEYIYSISADGKRFEILGEIEKASLFSHTLPITPIAYAASSNESNEVALVNGTYL